MTLFPDLQTCLHQMHLSRHITSGHMCDDVKARGLSRKVQRSISMCHATRTQRWSHDTRCHTQPVLSLSESLLRSHWTLLTCILFQVSIKHAPTHENTSKLVLLNHFTSEASPCWSPMGISTLQCIMSNLFNVKYCLPMLYFYYIGGMNTTLSLVTKQTCLSISTDHCFLMTGI